MMIAKAPLVVKSTTKLKNVSRNDGDQLQHDINEKNGCCAINDLLHRAVHGCTSDKMDEYGFSLGPLGNDGHKYTIVFVYFQSISPYA